MQGSPSVGGTPGYGVQPHVAKRDLAALEGVLQVALLLSLQDDDVQEKNAPA